MKLTKLIVENFMSVRSCEVDLNNRGLMLIQGDNMDEDSFESNGAGKSTVFSDAPTWCLYGETPRGYKADKVINRHVGKNTRVSLTILDDNGDVYEIVRHRKHKEHKNHVLLHLNGENITAKSDTDTDRKIVDLLELDFLSFTNSVMFGQGITNMFASATDGEQKKILERMLQIDIFKACQDRAKEHLATKNEERNKLINSIDANEREKVTIEQAISDLQDKEAKLGIQVQKRIGELRDEYNKLDGELCALPATTQLEEDEDRIGNLVSKLQAKIDSFREYEDSKLELSGDIRALQSDIIRLEESKKGLLLKLADLQDNLNSSIICDECGQAITKEHRQSHLDSMSSRVQDINRHITGKHDEIAEIQKLLDGVNKVLANKQTLEDQKRQLRDEVVGIKSEIKSVDDKRLSIEKMMRTAYTQIKQQQELADTTYVDLIESNVDKVDYLKQIISQQYDALDQYSAECDKYEFWINAFGNQGIKSVLLDSVTPFLNQRANYYLTKLSGSSIEVEFTTQTTLKSGEVKDKFAVGVTNHNGDNDYKGNSNGEKRRIDLAINLALQDLVSSRSSKSIDFVVYDEAFEGLDGIGCENLISILQEKQQRCGTILVITHNDSLKQLFNNSIVVSKSEGKTIIRGEM